ncbi:serine O-acetyltransferase [Paraburkholderia sp. DD10]|uniref:serine O-acetyltransferase n=1 Tax=Paraburkholderia TaxID=1822464 RepID=UPI00241455AD|nr:serine O-acetyltransferase [Paraburkholderia terricola]
MKTFQRLPKTMKTTIELIKSDLFRVAGRIDLKCFMRKFIGNEGFNYMFWFRLASAHRNGVIGFMLRAKLRATQRKFGIVIPVGTTIGPGFFISHFGGIVVNETAVFGSNCNISQCTTIGSNHGKAATIGNNVYIGPNVCIVEAVTIGDNVTIGAGSVVTRDVVAGVTVAGSPARVMTNDAALNREGRYITRRWVTSHPEPRQRSEV